MPQTIEELIVAASSSLAEADPSESRASQAAMKAAVGAHAELIELAQACALKDPAAEDGWYHDPSIRPEDLEPGVAVDWRITKHRMWEDFPYSFKLETCLSRSGRENGLMVASIGQTATFRVAGRELYKPGVVCVENLGERPYPSAMDTESSDFSLVSRAIRFVAQSSRATQ